MPLIFVPFVPNNSNSHSGYMPLRPIPKNFLQIEIVAAVSATAVVYIEYPFFLHFTLDDICSVTIFIYEILPDKFKLILTNTLVNFSISIFFLWD